MRTFNIDRPHGLDSRPVALAIGTFDGVHIGHRALVARMVEVANELGGQAGVMLPEPHPMAIVDPGQIPPILTPLGVKVGLLAGTGADWVAVLPFDREWARVSPEEFARRVIVDYLGARHVVVGFNFTFGHRGQGTSHILSSLGTRMGFEVEVLPPVEVGGEPVSSSRVRAALDAGDVAAALELLGRPFGLQGMVVPGDGRGRRLGIPTANLQVDPDLARPGHGVYAVGVLISGRRYAGVANIGLRPTFSSSAGDARIEVHVMDLDGDIYGQRLAVEFLDRLRDERTFPGPEQLQRQVRDDIDRARRLVLCFEPYL